MGKTTVQVVVPEFSYVRRMVELCEVVWFLGPGKAYLRVACQVTAECRGSATRCADQKEIRKMVGFDWFQNITLRSRMFA